MSKTQVNSTAQPRLNWKLSSNGTYPMDKKLLTQLVHASSGNVVLALCFR